MDQLRVKLHCQRKTMSILDLPPTSYAMTGHILRAFYSTYIQHNCLGDLPLNPTEYGYTLQDAELIPITYRALYQTICQWHVTASNYCQEDHALAGKNVFNAAVFVNARDKKICVKIHLGSDHSLNSMKPDIVIWTWDLAWSLFRYELVVAFTLHIHVDCFSPFSPLLSYDVITWSS